MSEDALAVYKERLSVYYDELKWLYSELYRDDRQAFSYFLTVLERAFTERDPSMKAWDRLVVSDRQTYRDPSDVGMQMYVECFGGDLAGVRAHLDYVRSVGVKFIHLMPILESPVAHSDGGYAVSDFGKVRAPLGTMEDFRTLAKDCHERGIRIGLDLVMNHTSNEHEWARRAKAGEKEYQDRYLFYDDWSIPRLYDQTVPQVFPHAAPGNFTWCPEQGKVVMTTFYPYQWDLNYRNPTVLNDMTAAMLNLCNYGADVIRLDAVSYLWKKLGTSCRDLPEVHTILRILRIAADVVCPGTLLAGDVAMEPAGAASYFGTPDKPECDMIYNVSTMASIWHTVATRDVRLLRHRVEMDSSLPKSSTYLNFLRSHDDIDWSLDYEFLKQFGIDESAHRHFLNEYFIGKWPDSGSAAGVYDADPQMREGRLCGTTASLCGIERALAQGEQDKLPGAIRLDLMLHALLLTQSGVPVLYSGDEIGQCNDDSYMEDPARKTDARFLHRGVMNWERAERRTEPGSVEQKLFDRIRELVQLRAQHRVFNIEADVWIVETWNDHVLGIGRYYQGEKLLAFFNFSDGEEIAWIDEAEPYVDLIRDRFTEAKAVAVPAHDFVWLLTTFG
ncbi:MAG: amylosucrase [Lachnospiraceae bacterium]|nr:amylosucrase [Lachnospiraceae bacterium]